MDSWKKHDPEPSVFGQVAGNPTEYVVYTLSVQSADDADVQAGMVEAVAQMCRLAEANVTARTEIVLFEWDAVSSTLTVVYTDRERSFDAREVLKVLAEGWEAASFDLGRTSSWKSGRNATGLSAPGCAGPCGFRRCSRPSLRSPRGASCRHSPRSTTRRSSSRSERLWRQRHPSRRGRQWRDR